MNETLFYRCQRCGTISESIVQVDSLYCTCAWRAIEVVELTPEQAQQERQQRYDDLPERDMDGSHFSVEPSPDEEQAYRAEQERWQALTVEQQHAELLDESLELNRHMRDLRGR